MGLSAFNRARRIAAEQRAEKDKAEQLNSEDALLNLGFPELQAAAKERRIEGYGKMTKEQLIDALKTAPGTKG